MKLPTSEIEKAAGIKDVRPYLNQPWLDVEKQRLLATDGHVLAIIPIKADELDAEDTSGPLTMAAIKAARAKSAHNTLVANGTIQVSADATVYPRPSDYVYPPVDKVQPAKPEREPDIVLDAALLHKLALALNAKKSKCKRISLWLPSEGGKASYVEGGIEGAHGAIMPLRA